MCFRWTALISVCVGETVVSDWHWVEKSICSCMTGNSEESWGKALQYIPRVWIAHLSLHLETFYELHDYLSGMKRSNKTRQTTQCFIITSWAINSDVSFNYNVLSYLLSLSNPWYQEIHHPIKFEIGQEFNMNFRM